MDRFETMKSLIEGENISINDEGAYRELLECAEQEAFDRHVEATKSLIDDYKNQYQYVLDQAENGELSLKVNQVGGEKSSDETEVKEEDAKKEDVETKEVIPAEAEIKAEVKADTEVKAESSEQKPEEKKEEQTDTDTIQKQETAEMDNDDILKRMSEILEAVMSGKQQYGRLEENFQEFQKGLKEELETLSKKVHNVSKKLKEVENSEYVSKSLDEDVSTPKERKEDDLFGSVFQGSPLQRRFEGSSEALNW